MTKPSIRGDIERRLNTLAYRMLGSVADAEDVVQEAQLRLHKRADPPEDTEAYLYRVVSNLCIDQLRKEQIVRKHYPGPWLPEPLPEDSPFATMQLAEELSFGLLHMLERLTPAERVVFVLSQGFDFSLVDAARVLGITASAARQRLRRARSKLAEPRQQPPAAVHKALLEQITHALVEEDIAALTQMLHEDVVAYTDGGGVVSAAIIPIEDRERVVQVFVHLNRRGQSEGEITYRITTFNGALGWVLEQNGQIHSCVQLSLRDGLVDRIYVVRNPQKLSQFKPAQV